MIRMRLDNMWKSSTMGKVRLTSLIILGVCGGRYGYLEGEKYFEITILNFGFHLIWGPKRTGYGIQYAVEREEALKKRGKIKSWLRIVLTFILLGIMLIAIIVGAVWPFLKTLAVVKFLFN